MSEKIAVTFNSNGKYCSFQEAFQLKVYEKTNTDWTVNQMLPLALRASESNELRIQLRLITDKLTDCKILLTTAITGISYHVFDKMNFSIFEAPTFSAELCDDIVDEIAANREELAIDRLISREPLELLDGCYYLDYLLLEKRHPEVTTKKILLPFFESTSFSSLTFRCSHLPPWLEYGEYAKKYALSQKEAAGGLLITLLPREEDKDLTS